MTANVKCIVEQKIQTFYETHIACWLAMIHFYLQFRPTCNLSSIPTQTQQLHYLASRTSSS